MKILIISSYPNPFQDEIQEWTFTKDGAVEEELPEAIEVGGNRLTFTHIYASREQEGIYTLTLGNYTVWFELEASGKILITTGDNIVFIFLISSCSSKSNV